MSKNLKRVALGILALALIVGSLSANAQKPNILCDVKPITCHYYWNYAVANKLSITISGGINLPEINPARYL